jgi:hypothetical protein
MTWSKSQAGSYLTLVSSSTWMPWWTHRRWPDTISYNIHKEVRYRPTQWHTKLISLGISYVPYASVHSSAHSFGPNRQRWGLPPWSSKFQIRHSFSFPSCILPFPLIAPPGLQLCQYLDHLAKPHRTSIDRKGPITSGFQPLDFYRLPIQLRIAFYHCLSFICLKKVV